MPRRKSDPDGEAQPASPAEGIPSQPDDSSAPAEAEAPAPGPLAEDGAPIDPAPAEPAEAVGSEPVPEALSDALRESDRAPVDPEPMREPTPELEREPAPAAPPTAGADAVVRDEAPRDEARKGRSFAARALTVLLLLLAGAGLGIWAAPRLAPMLPAGLAPVAAWMTPGVSEGAARLDALAAEMDARITAAEARIAALPGEDAVDARIDAAVSQAAAQISGQSADAVAALRAQLEELDTTAMRQRLDALASTLGGQAAELSTLKDQIEGGAAAGSALTEDTAQRIDVYRAELDGLRAEVGALGNQTSALAARLEEVATTAERSIEAAEARVAAIEADATDALGAAQTASDVAELRAALAAGQPFAEVAERIEATTAAPLPEGIAAAAASGAPTAAALRDSFPEAAHAAIRASIIASAGEGILARSRAYLGAQIASRSLTPQPGMTPDAILSRMEEHLRRGELQAALDEAENLPSEAAAAMGGWLAGARLRLAAETGAAALGEATSGPAPETTPAPAAAAD